MEFSCVKDCSQCCMERQYYPSKKFGKVGVLILPHERDKIEKLAKLHNLEAIIVPRIGISYQDLTKPEKVIAYQMIGKEKNGDVCPFLDTESAKRAPHGGFVCKIYKQRPLACKAYPLIEIKPITLDSKCKFCQTHKTADSNLDDEIESLINIKTEMTTTAPTIWRYATGISNDNDSEVQKGWFKEA